MPQCVDCRMHVEHVVRGYCQDCLLTLDPDPTYRPQAGPPLPRPLYWCEGCGRDVPTLRSGRCSDCWDSALAERRQAQEASRPSRECRQCGATTRVMGHGLCFHCMVQQVHQLAQAAPRESGSIPAVTVEVHDCMGCPFSDGAAGALVCRAVPKLMREGPPRRVPEAPGRIAEWCPIQDPVLIQVNPRSLFGEPGESPPEGGTGFWDHVRDED